MATESTPRRVLGQPYRPWQGSSMFLGVVSLMTCSTWAYESRKYFRISALVREGSGPPPTSHFSGGVCLRISAAKPTFAQATCFSCSAKVRTFVNAPDVGLKPYL